MGPALESWGVRCLQGFAARNLEPAPDLVIIGNVCRRDNPEVARAFERGLRYTHIAGALAEFVLGDCSPLVVAGTHGKTTTAALAAHLLEACGFAPGFLIGGLPKNLPRSFRAAQKSKPRLATGDRPLRKPPFVIEGDEYDTAFFEKTAKFLHYRPEVAILTFDRTRPCRYLSKPGQLPRGISEVRDAAARARLDRRQCRRRGGRARGRRTCARTGGLVCARGRKHSR